MPATRTGVSESTVEKAALEWLAEVGWQVRFGPEIAPGEPLAERTAYDQILLTQRLRDAVDHLNPNVPMAAREDAVRRITSLSAPALIARNRAFHRLLCNGIEVELPRPEGGISGHRVRLIDADHAEANDWLAVNQFTVVEEGRTRRPDVVLFVNGLPLVVVELKDPTKESADIWSAFHQLQTYHHELTDLFAYNEALVISNGVEARIGSMTSDREWFMRWRTIDGVELASPLLPELEVLIKGMLTPRRLLGYLREFVVFEEERGKVSKKLAGYHQYHAVNAAVEATLTATGPSGDRRAGVVWHTQGSGKSLTMVFFAGRIVLEPELENPTIVVLTDRNDLDDQLFGTFARCHELLRQTPVQAESSAHLRQLLSVAAGGVVFTTLQKFLPDTPGARFPLLTARRNVVVIADEAHRSQYDFIDGFARNLRDALPGATFIGFTGTPIELEDHNTRAVFGDYIDIYDIQRAVEDGATVPIYYESRLAKLALPEEEKPKVDIAFEDVTEGEEETAKERLKSKWAALEGLVGTEKRLALVARDLVEHFEQRTDALEGKAMVVTMSRRIAVELHDQLVSAADWYAPDDDHGALKVVMTGSASDAVGWQPHIRNKTRREALADRFRDPADPFRIVIVRDMWLTGFDAPSLHTMYVDKPMRGHALMQAIARVNRVFRDKPGGLVVDYLGLADELRKALHDYTTSGGMGNTAVDQAEAVAVMLEKYEIVVALFHGFDYRRFFTGTPTQRVSVLPAALEHVLAQEDGKTRLTDGVAQLSKAFALAVPYEAALRIRDDVAFFQAVKAALPKPERPPGRGAEELEHAVRQIVAGAIVSEGVIDVFAAAGLPKPDISILSDEFLADVRGLPQKNLAVELLRKLLADEVRSRARRNLVQARMFSEMLERSIRAYQNRAIETAAVIEELIELAREMREAKGRGEKLGLSEDELAFYDALETNDSAVAILGDETLRHIAQELAITVRSNTTIDWAQKESVRARLRLLVKRLLRRYGYPPDKQERATKTVLEQAELLSERWGMEPPAESAIPVQTG